MAALSPENKYRSLGASFVGAALCCEEADTVNRQALSALGGQDPLVVVNGEIVAVEVIRALVGSIGIVMAVPLTTLVAAALVVRSPAPNAGT